MVFNDVVAVLNDKEKELEELTIIINPLREILVEYNNKKDYIFNSNLRYQVESGNWSVHRDTVRSLIGFVKNKFKNIKLLKLGRILVALEDNNNCGLKNDLYTAILVNINSYCENIEEFMALNDNEQLEPCISLLNKTRDIVKQIDDFIMIKNYLEGVNNFIENSYTENEDESVFLIRFYRENITTKEFAKYIEIIDSIYEKSCKILNISSQDYQIKPIKIESGSLLEKVLGNAVAFKFVSDLLSKAITYMFKDYTQSGKINKVENKIELLKKGIELTEFCKERGINVEGENEKFKDDLNILCNDIHKLISGNSKITINQTTYDINEEISNKILKESKQLYINDRSEITTDNIEKREK